ncbi:uncharacterized protein LOC106664372 [Cimex lectularius]|uniref:MADF domain-containing protein n=1 Tax=Cimex lectularius TaxID=79782 RepID=A0A8I6RG11_CIMLE|nr:uncharacterized protein LOC106664372 [Cimex lectularius]
MEWSNKVIMEFLDLYEGEPSIWNLHHADHKDRNNIYEAWKRIQGSISVDCSLKELKKKKEALMATYRKLALKVKKSSKNHTRTEEAFKPKWFAYEKMESFLHSIYEPRKTKMPDKGPENERDDPPTNEHPTPDSVESSDINTASHDEETHITAGTEAAAIDQGGLPSSRKRKADMTGNVEKRKDEDSLFEHVANKSKPANDECSLFCDLLCLKLKALDDDTREIAMHEINNLMFNFKIPKLRQSYWSYTHNYRQPRRANPVESSVDGSDDNSVSSHTSHGHNPPAASTP